MAALSVNDDGQDGLEAALLVLDEYMTSEWSEGADESLIDLDNDITMHDDDQQCHSDPSDDRSNAPRNQTQAPRRRRSKSTSKLTAATSSSGAISKDALGGTSTKKSISWDPNKARNERKGEVLYLRKRVSDLEAKLQRLIDSKQSIDVLSPPGTPDNSQHGATALSSSQPIDTEARGSERVGAMWQDLAHRQCQERLKSERENIRLKLVLEKQLKIAKTLDKIVSKKAAIKELERCVQDICIESERNPGSPGHSGASDTEELRLLGE